MKKHIFIHGLGYKKDYRNLQKYFKLPTINWNTWETKIPKGTETLIGYSLGALIACEYAMKHRVKNLILCSMTPGVETLAKVKAKNIIFLVGEKEDWVYKDSFRIMQTAKNSYRSLFIVEKGGHKLDKRYVKKLLALVKNL